MSRRGRLGNDKAQQEQRDSERRRRRQHADDLRQLMATEYGRRIVYRLTHEVGNLARPSYSPNQSAAAYAEGVRSVGIWLMEQAQQHCLEQWLRMMQERTATAVAELAMQQTAVTAEGEDDGD